MNMVTKSKRIDFSRLAYVLTQRMKPTSSSYNSLDGEFIHSCRRYGNVDALYNAERKLGVIYYSYVPIVGAILNQNKIHFYVKIWA